MKIKLTLTRFTRRTDILFLTSITVILLITAMMFFYLYLQAENQQIELNNQNSALVQKIGDFEEKLKAKEHLERDFASLQEQQKAFMAQLDVCATMIGQLKNKGVVK